MSPFEKNVISIYGDKGKVWLASLPTQVQQIAALWELDRLRPFENLSYNYVLEGYKKGKPIVLKLSLDELSLGKEIKALEAFAGYGAVSVLEHTKDIVLLQRAVPGIPLKNQFSKDPLTSIEIACDVMKKLHQAPLPKARQFPHIKDWLRILDKEWNIPRHHLERARRFKNQLIESETPMVLLHGDLHQDNILSNGNDWLVIDPKGVIGYPINEMWASVENPRQDLKFISDYFDFSFENVVKWYYVHLVMAACWQVEDQLDPTSFLKLADSAESMTTL